MDAKPAEVDEDEPGMVLLERLDVPGSLEELRAARAAAGPPLARAVKLRGLLWMQGAGKHGARSRAEGDGD